MVNRINYMNQKLIKRAEIEMYDRAYSKGFEEGLRVGMQKGISDAIERVSKIKQFGKLIKKTIIEDLKKLQKEKS